jgi:hypothetical protein
MMERFGNLLNSYTKSFNKGNKRRGGLFMKLLMMRNWELLFFIFIRMQFTIIIPKQ